MKKVLLSLLAMVFAAVIPAMADSYTIKYATASSESATYSNTANAYSEGMDFVQSITQTRAYAPAINGLKLGSAKGGGTATLTLSAAGKVAATSVVVNAQTFSEDATKLTVTVGSASQTFTMTSTATDYTLNLDGAEISTIKVESGGSNSKKSRCYVSSITVNYGGGGGNTVLAPSIACVDNVVTITNNEEGASVYYTIDGTEPDANSTLYTAPFAITETCTVKAVAIKDGESSITTTYNATFVAPAEVEPFTSSIAAVDDVITAARGTEITFTSLHAAKIAVEIDVEGHETTTTEVESDKFVYTVSEAAVISLISYNVDGSEAHSAVYEIALEAAPLCGEVVFNPASGSAVIAGSEVTITCENAATITYIIEINGELGDAIEVEGNEAKVVVNEACTIHADAKNIDGVPSEAAEASYTIAEAPATGDFTFVFGVDGQNVIELANKEIAVSSESSKLEDLNNLDGVKFTAPDGCSIEFSIGTSRNAPRFFKSASSVKNPATDHVRVYNGNTMTVSVPEGTVITSLSFTQVTNATTWTEMPADPAGTWSGKTWTPASAASAMMREAAKGVESVTFKPTGTTHFATVTVNYERPTTGVGSVVVDDANAPVEYYNLQGVRVENPANGLYIRRQGNNVSKVFVR